MLKRAIAAVKEGQRDMAWTLLQAVLETEPNNELAWLWRVALAESRKEAFAHLTRLLRINPRNDKALSWLAKLTKAPQRAPVATPPAPQTWTCPFCEQVFQDAPDRCLGCQTFVRLGSLDRIAANEQTKREILIAAIGRFEKTLAGGPDFSAEVNLALAYLNLKKSSDAVKHLRQACALRPQDRNVEQQLELLLQRKMILVVDDSPTVRQMVATVLERNRYRVSGAANGLEALTRLAEEAPDVILLDVKMPGMDGYQVCRAIKSNPSTSTLPVIMISSSLMDWVRGRMVGVTEYLPKPFGPGWLVQKLQYQFESGDSKTGSTLNI